MGLDNYWVKIIDSGDGREIIPMDELPDGERPAFDPPLYVCGGLFSGGDYSFRGKVYVGLILEVTGYSLYDEHIENDGILAIADALEDFIARHDADLEAALTNLSCFCEREPEEVRDLARMFRAFGEAGAALEAWA